MANLDRRRLLPNMAVEKEDKILCVSVRCEDRTRRWFVIDPRLKLESEEGVEIVEMRDYPSYMNEIVGYGVAVVDSKIYYLGGMCDDVSIFNTSTGCWSEGPPLKVVRFDQFVIVIDKKIYVFGKGFGPIDISANDWAECYDVGSSSPEWQILPCPTLEQIQCFFGPIDAVVVYQDNIFFWGINADDEGIFVYNHRSNFWTFHDGGFPKDDTSPKPPSDFMTNHVVIGDFALWHDWGNMYAWNLTNHHTTLLCPLEGFQLNDSIFSCLDPGHTVLLHAGNGLDPGPTVLLHAGNGLLCLLRWDLYYNKPKLCCHKFQIEGSTQSEIDGACHLKIISLGIQFFDVPGVVFARAFALL